MASFMPFFGATSGVSAPNFLNVQSQSSSWISNIKKVITRETEDDDTEYEDCSHVSNVLRTYYNERGRKLPDWLPPDPKKPYSTYNSNPQANYGHYGGTHNPEPVPRIAVGAAPAAAAPGRAGLSDLWDASPAAGPQSLRAPRTAQVGQGLRPQDALHPTQSYQQQGMPSRPQFTERAMTSSPGVAGGPGGGQASKDRLRARLQGGGGASGRNSPMASATDLDIGLAPPKRPGMVSHHSYDSRGTGVSMSQHVAGPEFQSSGEQLRRYPTGPR